MAKVSLGQNIARSLARYRNLSLSQIAALYWRALRLHRTQAAPKPVAPAAVRDKRIVITLTTIPSRANRVRPALLSLLDQTCPADRIVLCLPHQSRRSAQPYPAPEALNLPGGVDILRCEDEGPATKYLPTLRAEPDALIIVVDDDVIYPRDFIASLLAAHRDHPNAVPGMRGVRLQPGVPFPELTHILCSAQDAPKPVDILFGTWGYLLPPGLLDAGVHDFSGYPEAVRWQDDVWISGHLARCGVQRLVIPTRNFPVETLSSSIDALTDGPNWTGSNDAEAIAAFAPHWDKDAAGIMR